MPDRRLTAIDAQTYWMSAAVPDDQFVLYVFEDGVAHLNQAIDAVRHRARACADLQLRIEDTGFWSYPVWTAQDSGLDQVVVHDLADATWTGVLATVTDMGEKQLDARVMTWRLHVFPNVEFGQGAGRRTVAVLQICHALADGTRASALGAHLFGRDGGLPPVVPYQPYFRSLPRRGIVAARAHRRRVRDVHSGLVPSEGVSRPVLRSNLRPSGARHLRTVSCERQRLGGPTVTVAVLAAISATMAGHLRALGDDPSELAAEIPLAKAGPRRAHNHFGNAGVGLYPGQERSDRMAAIAADLRSRRRRAAHPATQAEDAAFAAVPAPLLRWAVEQFDVEAGLTMVTGNTVVSSVNHGENDLRFGGAPAVLIAGFAGLSPMMALTHGVHGIGDTVVVSVQATEPALGDVDAYVERLTRELFSGN